jgi:hypothetical protein
MSNAMNLFVPITKVDAVQRLVYGTLASECVDKSGEVFDYESSKPHVEEWSAGIAKATDGKSVGNLRAMHGKVAAGKFTELTCNDQAKSIDVCAKIIDAAEWEKVAEGVYTGFSIGGKYIKKWTDGDGNKRYTAQPSEGSIVDNPDNPNSMFTMIKEGGAVELRKFHQPPAEAAPSSVAPAASATPAPVAPVSPPPDPELEQVWKAKDGATFATKALAKSHNDELAKADASAREPANQLAAAIADATAAVQKVEEAHAAAPATVEKKEFSQAERDKAAESGAAMKDGSYPISSKEDLKNAIQAFGRAKNKKATKAHIIARAKDLGAEDALPDSWKPGADKALRFGDLRKDLSDVCRLAVLIQELEWLQQSTEWEAEREKDKSTVPDTLKQNIAALCASLRAMVEEETNELLDEQEAVEFGEMLEMSARTRGVDALAKALGGKSPAWLAKMGMRHGKADKEHLDAAHDHVMAMGIGKCAGMGDGKAAGDELGKAGARHSKADAEHLQTAHDALTKAGAECPADGADGKDGKDADARSADKAAQSAGLTKALEDERGKTAKLEKAMTDAVATVNELAGRIKKLEDQPMPHPRDRAPNGNYRVVDKAHDDVQAQLEEIAKSDPDQISAMLIEIARRNGRAITR